MLAEVKRRVTLLKDHLQAEYRSTDDPFCIPCSNRASPRMLKRNETCDGLSLAALEAYLDDKGQAASEIIGLAADRRKTFAEMPELQDHWKGFLPPESR